MNAIELSSLPRLTNLLPTDKIYVFTDRNGDYEMNAVTFNQLSAYLYSYDMVQKYNEKFKNLQQLSTDFMNFLNTTYPTTNYITHNYITIYDFLEEIKDVITIQDALSVQLIDYANLEYLNYMKLKLYKEEEIIKKNVLASITSQSLQSIIVASDL